jgi:phage shock protein A|tara:strand:- start:1193 stop:1534 length:342 start_codon:yes stop_codon:yes gene_type:complete
MSKNRQHLTDKYPESKTIREALLKRNKLNRKVAVCEHDNIDYKSMALLAKKSIKVIENLAAAVASLEQQNTKQTKATEKVLLGFIETAQKMIGDQKDEIDVLKKRLGVMKNVH